MRTHPDRILPEPGLQDDHPAQPSRPQRPGGGGKRVPRVPVPQPHQVVVFSGHTAVPVRHVRPRLHPVRPQSIPAVPRALRVRQVRMRGRHEEVRLPLAAAVRLRQVPPEVRVRRLPRQRLRRPRQSGRAGRHRRHRLVLLPHHDRKKRPSERFRGDDGFCVPGVSSSAAGIRVQVEIRRNRRGGGLRGPVLQAVFRRRIRGADAAVGGALGRRVPPVDGLHPGHLLR